jgi:hypothetical protein
VREDGIDGVVLGLVWRRHLHPIPRTTPVTHATPFNARQTPRSGPQSADYAEALVLGTMLTIRVERIRSKRISRMSVREIVIDHERGKSYTDLLNELVVKYLPGENPDTDLVHDRTGRFEPLRRAANVSPQDMRARLLASGKTEVYGEYDRFASEASFRVNIVLPIFAIGVLASVQASACYLLATVSMAAVLLLQGFQRLGLALETIRTAAVNGMFIHPLEELLRRDYGTPDATGQQEP